MVKTDDKQEVKKLRTGEANKSELNEDRKDCEDSKDSNYRKDSKGSKDRQDSESEATGGR